MSLRDEILGCDDIVWKSVEAWGKTIWLRSLTGEEKDEFEASILVRKGKGRKARREADTHLLRAKLVVKAAVVAQGSYEPVFKPEDYKGLAAKNGAVLEKVFDVASELAGLNTEDIEQEGND